MVVSLAKTNPVSVRFPPEVKDAIERAAQADTRSMSSLIEKVMTDWLRQNDYLPAAKARTS